MKSTKKDFPEGTWFAVPLRNGGFARGVIARTTGKGVAFGYFFGPKADCIEAIGPCDNLKSTDAVLLGQFGDRGFLKGTWPKLGHGDGWDRNHWPMPSFIRVDEVAGSARLSTYDDDFNLLSDEPCDIALSNKYPRDALMGCGSVEIKLTRLLDAEGEASETPVTQSEASISTEQSRSVWHYVYFPSKESGKKVAQALAAKGFAVEDRLGADNVNWLVLAKHWIVPGEAALEELRVFFEAIAAEHDGEYDGWEAAAN